MYYIYTCVDLVITMPYKSQCVKQYDVQSSKAGTHSPEIKTVCNT